MINCKKCKHHTLYIWSGDDYHRELYSCKWHMDMWTEECKFYEEKQDTTNE